MDESFRKLAEEWFEKGDHDLETAQLLYDECGHSDSIVFHIHQAIEKYIKGYLVLNGRRAQRIHELDALLAQIADFDDSLGEFIGFCEKASRFYIESRYPLGIASLYDYAEIKADLDIAWEMIKRIRAKCKSARRWK